MLTKQDMIDYIAAGCKPREAWRIGTEHEKFLFTTKDHQPVSYEGPQGVKAMLEGMQRFGWAPVFEGENVIALKKNNCNISLEPGGQFELSGAPLANLHETCQEVHGHLAEVKYIAEELGLGLLGLGFHPQAKRKEINWMPKGRYKIMRAYMPTVGTHGLDMMTRSCTVQVNLDFASEADMAQKMRISAALQPVITALFANSPFWEGKPNGRLSNRNYLWQHLDPDRTGLLPMVFEPDFGFERYVDYALGVPMYFRYRKGIYHNMTGRYFGPFNEGQYADLANDPATLQDWEDHLTTLFPEVRSKRYIEMRGADAGPWSSLCALPAIWVGLLYDQTALESAYDLIKDWSYGDVAAMAEQVPAQALKAEIKGRSVHAVAREVVAIADAGLKNRAIFSSTNLDETQYLAPLHDIVESGKTRAERLVELYHSDWQGDVSRLFTEHAY